MTSLSMTPSHVCVIVLVVVVKMAACTCPQICSCRDVTNGLRAECRGRALTDHVIAAGGKFLLSVETAELDVGRNGGITTLDWLSTLTAPRMRRLYADRCAIRRISAGTFSHFQFLQYIDLSFNHIDQLFEDVFSGLPALRTLRLDNNRLDAIEPNVFRGLRLSTLRLGENDIRELDLSAFYGAAVETLNLDRNRLGSVLGRLYTLKVRTERRN